jgi:hypothetical protein
VIRNVVMVELTPDADLAKVAEIQDGLRAVNTPGTIGYSLGDDAGLREGNWSFAIVCDFTDADAYRTYDLDAEHNRLRGELAAFAAQIARVQFQLPDA